MLEKYFIKFHDKLAYLELKEDSPEDLLKGLPLPIYLGELKEGLVDGSLEEEIGLKSFLDGMLINIAIDPEFRYKDEYVNILNNYIGDITNYTASLAIEEEGRDYDKSILLARAGYILNPLDNYNSYIYARLLWPLAYKEDKYKEEFIRESLRILQETIRRDENFAVAYYELANIYANLGEYIKARSYYDNALTRTDRDEAKEEIRNKLMTISDNADIEESLYYIGKGNNDQAIKILTKLLSNKKRADAYYYLGVAYQNVGQYQNSIMAFDQSLEEGGDFRELYNDYAISLFLDKREEEALAIIDQGLERFPQDPRLSYNKVQVDISLGYISRAYDEIEELLTYDDISDEIRNNLEIIKNQITK